jgi:putative ABC transport system permease protein
MGIAQSFILAIKSLLNNKMRAFLTMLGIIIGVGSVILIMSLGNGMTSEISDSFESMGTQSITVTIMGRGSTRTFTDRDMYELVAENSRTMKAVTPTVTVSATVRPSGWNDNLSSSVTGVGEDWLTVKTYETAAGRFITYADIHTRKKVCFVGAYFDSAEVYNGSAVGSRLKINGDIYTIIGVADEISDATDEDGSDNFVVIPYTVALRLSRMKNVSTYTVLASGDDTVTMAKQTLLNALYAKYEDEDAYSVLALAEMLDTVTEIMDTLVLVIAAIAAISLLVGGIGIMNIMLVSVTERTREIGIRKALGAKRRDIKLQFVIEAATTSLIGGIFGILFGIVGANIAGKLLSMSAKPSVSSIVLSVGISVGIGVLFGYLPAKKASELNPIDALHHE